MIVYKLEDYSTNTEMQTFFNFIGFDLKIYDLRLPSKLLLYIKNINQNPVCLLNFNNTSICNLQFNNPLTLSSLDLEFYTEDNSSCFHVLRKIGDFTVGIKVEEGKQHVFRGPN